MRAVERATDSLPAHLRRFVVDQDWDAYTPRDHAVWRHVLRRLVAHLRDRAHESYVRGLDATGIGTERVPRLEEMNEKLSRFGWSAVAVRGFIPPAVFTEFQSRRVLAIACDIRSHEHVAYTPAPDIIHESAGHAPILADPRYAEYLRRCGEVGWKAIASVADDAVFQAIRQLSIAKEDPGATPEELRLSGERLAAASCGRRHASESTRASRLYWWTAEYGLVGSPGRPRIYGAGLLSSIGESVHCLSPEVRREPLTAACAGVEYDITEMQPRLFVVPEFEALFDVLEEFASGLSYRVGGDHGLAEALRAGTVNHVVLSSGLEVSGRVAGLVEGIRPAGPGLRTALVRVDGPVLLSRGCVAEGSLLEGTALVATGSDEPLPRGRFRIELSTGLELEGFSVDGRRVEDLQAWMGGRPLQVPPACQVVLGRALPSVAGGPADPGAWERWSGAGRIFTEGDGEARARARKAAALPAGVADLYAGVRRIRESGRGDPAEADRLREAAARLPGEWLLREEIDELFPG